MLRQAIESIRLLLGQFQDIPPLPRRIFVPGAVLLLTYPLLSVLLGPGEEGQAFVTAFLLALALRIGLRFESMVRQLVAQFSLRETVYVALIVAFAPLMLIAAMDDPIWCQRLQSLYFIVFGMMFVSDVIANRVDMAARLWPEAPMRAHLPVMTRVMVIYNFVMLLLNETMITALDPSHWLLFWAVLPVIAHFILSALILTVIEVDHDRDARA